MKLANFNTVLMGDMAAKGFTALFAVMTIRLMAPASFASFVYLGALIILSFSLVSGFFNRQFMLSDVGGADLRAFQLTQVAATGVVMLVCLAILRPALNVHELVASLFTPVFAAAYDFCRTVRQRQGNFLRYSVVEVGRTMLVFFLALPIFLVPGKFQVAGLIAAQGFSYFCGAYALRLDAVWRPDGAAWSRVLRGLSNKAAMSVLLYWTLVALFGQVPILAAKFLGSPDILASLGSAMRYYGIVLSIVVAANIVTLPIVTRAKSNAEVYSAVVKSYRILILATCLILACAYAGYQLIPLVDGGKYPDSPLQYVLLCMAIVSGIPMAPISGGLLRLGHVNLLIVAMGISVVIAAGFPMVANVALKDAIPMGFALGALAQLLFAGFQLWLRKQKREEAA
jgi:hypothetical protein